MKGIDIFCASQAATAVCLSMEEASSSSSSSSPSSTIALGGCGSRSPAIDRYNPIITDSRRAAKPFSLCTTSQPPAIPKPLKNRHKKKNQRNPPKENGDQAKKNDNGKEISKQTSTNNGNASAATTTATAAVVRKSWSCTKPGDFISPPGSTRYLLSEKAFFNALSDFDPALKLFPAETSKSKVAKTNESFDAKPPSSSASPDQVVVLKVSLHCRGCERKMRKHLSRMEGVTSFNIDFAAKKVTVTGNVTPVEVLSSISKVKNAQLWPPTISSSTPPASPLNLSNSEFKNEFKGAGAWVTDEGTFVGIAS